jgi:catechol 2,3-dioxygenase-like lactoylglutathione lyase family enzyme
MIPATGAANISLRIDRSGLRNARFAASVEEPVMSLELDHIILSVNDRARSVAFYEDVLGLHHDGDRGPFADLRVSPGFVIQIAQWGTTGGQHLAFAMSKAEFDSTFDRIRAAGIAYGDRYDLVGNMRGPGDEAGSRGPGKAVYFFDPDKHLLEIRHYE